MRRYPTNRYTGVNAHLNSYLLSTFGSWSSFHAAYIAQLRQKLDIILPSNYYALSEQGLQLNFITDDDIEQNTSRPDILILETTPNPQPRRDVHSQAGMSFAFAEIEELINEEDILARIAIYEMAENLHDSRLVTTIEVLSPANKPNGSNYQGYLEKRSKQLHAAINLVEIDLIHTKPPMLSRIPSYPRRKAASVPYGVIVNLPKPNFEEGQSIWHPVAVDEALPILPLPLAADDSIAFALQDVYNELFASVRFYSQYVDYDSLPVNFEAYSPDDQAKIKAMLEQIRV